jgi:dTMP kinase
MTSGVATGKRGLFITFEGPDGSGKSTQMRILVERLRSSGRVVTVNQEPGGTGIGQQVRKILLNPENHDMAPLTELFLMFASRTQAAAETIRPALTRGEIVVSDRFTDSSLAYQGGGREIGFDLVLAVHRLALGSLCPDFTILIDVDLELGLKRAHGRNRETQRGSEARLDEQAVEFHERVRAAYLHMAALERERVTVFDGAEPIDVVAEKIWQRLTAAHPHLLF